MNKHTPGPWHVEIYNEGRNMDVQDAKGRGVLTKENAQLIAAAPELLAALEAFVQHGTIDPEDRRRARAAITKARGA